jgi:hypothetical protein
MPATSTYSPGSLDEPVSPELALVDPTLAERARRVLSTPAHDRRQSRAPDPEPRSVTGDRMPAAPRPAPAPRPTEAVQADAGAPAKTSTGRRRTRLTTGVLLGSVLLNVLLLRDLATLAPANVTVAATAGVASHARATPQRKRVKRPINAAAKRVTRRDSAKPVVRRTHRSLDRLRWPRGDAVSYAIVVWRGGSRAADITTRNRSLSTTDLRCALGRRSKPGRYLVFVYPVRRRLPRPAYGPLLKWGALQLDRDGRCPRPRMRR